MHRAQSIFFSLKFIQGVHVSSPFTERGELLKIFASKPKLGLF